MFTLYVWIADDEGGYGICRCGEFSPKLNYYPLSGWRAKPSEKIGDFTTKEELTNLLFAYDPEWFETIEMAEEEARWLMVNCMPQ